MKNPEPWRLCLMGEVQEKMQEELKYSSGKVQLNITQ